MSVLFQQVAKGEDRVSSGIRSLIVLILAKGRTVDISIRASSIAGSLGDTTPIADGSSEASWLLDRESGRLSCSLWGSEVRSTQSRLPQHQSVHLSRKLCPIRLLLSCVQLVIREDDLYLPPINLGQPGVRFEGYCPSNRLGFPETP